MSGTATPTMVLSAMVSARTPYVAAVASPVDRARASATEQATSRHNRHDLRLQREHGQRAEADAPRGRVEGPPLGRRGEPKQRAVIGVHHHGEDATAGL